MIILVHNSYHVYYLVLRRVTDILLDQILPEGFYNGLPVCIAVRFALILRVYEGKVKLVDVWDLKII